MVRGLGAGGGGAAAAGGGTGAAAVALGDGVTVVTVSAGSDVGADVAAGGGAAVVAGWLVCVGGTIVAVTEPLSPPATSSTVPATPAMNFHRGSSSGSSSNPS